MKTILFSFFILVGLVVECQVKPAVASGKKATIKKTSAKKVLTKKVSANVKEGSIKKVSIKDVRAMMDTSTTPLIVNFWASWCGPCIREIPYFDSLVGTEKRPVKLLLVSLDFASAYPKELTDFVKMQGYKGEVVFLNEFNADYFCPVIDKKWTGAIPVSVFINNAKHYRQFYSDQLTRERFFDAYAKLF